MLKNRKLAGVGQAVRTPSPALRQPTPLLQQPPALTPTAPAVTELPKPDDAFRTENVPLPIDDGGGGAHAGTATPLEDRRSGATDVVMWGESPKAGNLRARLDQRGRDTLPTRAYQQVYTQTLAPLQALLTSPQPDPKQWNRATWNAFQAVSRAAASQPPLTLPEGDSPAALASALETAAGAHGGTPLGEQLRAAATELRSGAAHAGTVRLLASTQGFTKQVMGEAQRDLSPTDRQDYCRAVHDSGYYATQKARLSRHATTGVETLLVPTASGKLTGRDGQGKVVPEADLVALLAPAGRQRYVGRLDPAAAGTELSMPKLYLSDFFDGPANDQQAVTRGTENALKFFKLGGKNVDAPNEDLGGKSLRQFLSRAPGESAEQHLQRMQRPIYNAWVQDWDGLISGADAYGPGAEAQRAFLTKKQEDAVGCAMVLLNNEEIFTSAVSKGTADEALGQRLDTALNVLWRSTNPELPFENPMISGGYGAAQTDDGVGLAAKVKDRATWKSVINVAKTRYLVGVVDTRYERRLGGFLDERRRELRSFGVDEHLARLFRDAGKDNPQLVDRVSRIAFDRDQADIVRELHGLRFDPSLYPIATGGQARVKLDGVELELLGPKGPDGSVLPMRVGATTLCYQVRAANGEEAVLRLPKGATYALDAAGNLAPNVFHESRRNDLLTRMGDQQAISQAYGLAAATHHEVRCGGKPVGRLEPHRAATLTGDSKGENRAPLGERGARTLVDLYVRGLGERNERMGRKYGVLYELGPENWCIEKGGAVSPLYVDAAATYRKEVERFDFGFFTGGYGAAANWVLGDATPLTADQVRAAWSGENLTPSQRQRRDLFFRMLDETTKPGSAALKNLAPQVRTQIRAELQTELAQLQGWMQASPTQ